MIEIIINCDNTRAKFFFGFYIPAFLRYLPKGFSLFLVKKGYLKYAKLVAGYLYCFLWVFTVKTIIEFSGNAIAIHV
ncbi:MULTISPECIES: hypothetical protein [Serratia]|jgi:hypothetical protein|uniref:hypothetical protein n=1 Tax=Serratia TaxID=613 RepID=UPI001AE60EF8|nr:MULTISPECIES: hypothetical protein [Serratia]MBP1129088.1 hypothetical protein [Serratia sp. PL17]